MTDKLDDRALDRLFRTARTRNAWTEQAVTQQQLRELYDLLKFGPTSGNCCPARFVWVRSAKGKSRLAALAAPTNAPKILAVLSSVQQMTAVRQRKQFALSCYSRTFRVRQLAKPARAASLMLEVLALASLGVQSN